MTADGSGPLWLRPGNPMGKVLLSILIFEVIAVGLALPVMLLVSKITVSVAVVSCVGLALLALVSAGLMRKPLGSLLGWLTQVGVVALGLLTPGMYIVGAMFLGIWVLTFVLGRKLDANAAAAG
ncbi:MAG: DUF4233 domain-containing protein [Propionibacteriaceae bacterium]